jgi:hypothetical protein
MHEIMVIMDLSACNVINMCFRLKKMALNININYYRQYMFVLYTIVNYAKKSTSINGISYLKYITKYESKNRNKITIG